jgi:hypothetical protein
MRFLFPTGGKRLIKAAWMAVLPALLLVGGFLLDVPFSQAAGLAQQHSQRATVYTSVTKGTIAPFGVANLQNPQAAAALVPTTKHRSKGARALPRTGQISASAQVSAAGLTKRAGAILQNFNGVSSLDSEVTNFGAEFEPPDQGLCVGNGFVIDAVNSAFSIYRSNGKVVLGPLNINALFDEGFLEFTSDPRCFFDKATHTWVAIILFIRSDNAEARTDIAVNHSGDPTTPWTVYHLEASDDGTLGQPNHAGCPCLGDQPLLGIDQQNVYVSTNEFSILGPEFNGAQIYALSKKQLFGLAQAVHFVQFDNLNIGGSIATSVQPATTYGAAGGEFFLNSLDPAGTGDNRIGVWALTHEEAVSAGGVPTLSSTVISSESYGVPPPAIQQGSTSTLDSGDDRMQQAQYIDGDLWGALDTTITIPNDSTARAGIAWFQVHPRLDDGLVSAPTLVHQGYVASAGNEVLYPAIQAGPDHSAALAFTFSGPNTYPSAAYAILREGQHTFGALTIAAPGTGPYVNGTRWGDYSYAVLDPDHNSFWLATEYVPPVGSQTTDGATNWGTEVFEVDGRS